jgi:hypothetical protein
LKLTNSGNDLLPPSLCVCVLLLTIVLLSFDLSFYSFSSLENVRLIEKFLIISSL